MASEVNIDEKTEKTNIVISVKLLWIVIGVIFALVTSSTAFVYNTIRSEVTTVKTSVDNNASEIKKMKETTNATNINVGIILDRTRNLYQPKPHETATTNPEIIRPQ